MLDLNHANGLGEHWAVYRTQIYVAIDQWFPTFFTVGAAFQTYEYVWSRIEILKLS